MIEFIVYLIVMTLPATLLYKCLQKMPNRCVVVEMPPLPAAKDAYVSGILSHDEFESEVEDILEKRCLPNEGDSR